MSGYRSHITQIVFGLLCIAALMASLGLDILIR